MKAKGDFFAMSMTDEELAQTADAALQAVEHRGDLKDALALYIQSGHKALELIERAIEERPHDLPPADVQTVRRYLQSELMWAKHLRGLVLDHDWAGRTS